LTHTPHLFREGSAYTSLLLCQTTSKQTLDHNRFVLAPLNAAWTWRSFGFCTQHLLKGISQLIVQDNAGPGRILMVVTGLSFGGAETQVVRLATEFKARNWQVRVACLVGPYAYVEQLERQGIHVHKLGMRRGLPDPRAIARLRSLIKSFSPDVVHCHMFHANILGRVTRLFCRMPALVCTVHNLRETSERGGPTSHKEFLYRLTDRLASRTTIICRAAFERYVRVGAVPRNRLQIIPNGVDTDVFSPSEALRSTTRKALGVGSRFVWLAVGRLVNQKDYPNLFHALARLDRSRFIVLIAGSGPLEPDLREQCARLGLDTCVQFCGAHEDIVPLYNAADSFVMSSEFEGLSVALLEATSIGLPAVVTDAGGNTEIVRDGETGYVVPPGDPAALCAAMQRMMNLSVEGRKTMGDAARQYCTQHYRTTSVVDRWRDLYAGCLPSERFHTTVPRYVQQHQTSEE
jgi:glycosyltransferase involved in cell wall biosynthesis